MSLFPESSSDYRSLTYEIVPFYENPLGSLREIQSDGVPGMIDLPTYTVD